MREDARVTQASPLPRSISGKGASYSTRHYSISDFFFSSALFLKKQTRISLFYSINKLSKNTQHAPDSAGHWGTDLGKGLHRNVKPWWDGEGVVQASLPSLSSSETLGKTT